MISATAVSTIGLTYASAGAWGVFTAANLATAANLQANWTDIASQLNNNYMPLLNSAVDEVNSLITAGTWTPYIEGDSISGTNTYLTQNGNYYKINRFTHVDFDVTITSKDSAMSGAIEIKNLPFKVATGMSVGGSIGRIYDTNLDTNYYTHGLQGVGGTNYIILMQFSTSSWDTINASQIGSSFHIKASMEYIATA
jgi:hypothetical protein